MEAWTVYRNPGLLLTHFMGEDPERTICKHYPIRKMESFLHSPDMAAIWCSDCLGGITRLAKENTDAQSA